MQEAVDLGPPDLLADLEVAVAVLRDVERRLDDATCARHASSVSGWTVGQQLIHVSLVASSLATALNVLIRRGGGEETSTAAAKELLEGGRIPRGVAQAPPTLARDESPSLDEIRAAHGKAARKWADLAARRADIQAARGTLPHPLLGPLDASEWVRFAAVHGRHHLEIVDAILAS